MRERDEYNYDSRQPYVVIDRHEGGIGSFLVGIAIGAGAALLFAPRSGPETRRMIGDGARNAGDTARRKADELVDSVNTAIGDVRSRITEQVDGVKSAMRQQRDEISGAFDAGRAAARDARAELEQKLQEQKQARREEPVL